LPIVQAIWPDRYGILPWEDGCGEGCRTNQPWLWIAKEEHPVGLWANLDAISAWTTHGVRANVQVFVTKRIVDGEEPVRGVVHDHDGSWQFLDGGPVERPDQIAAAHLRHILLDHPYVAEFADLPVGTQAWQQEDGSCQQSLNWALAQRS
jgi:hypothetical protein